MPEHLLMNSEPTQHRKTHSTSSRRGVSARAILIGCLLIPPNAFWVVRMERVLFGPYPSTISLFANVVFVLTVLLAINAATARIAPSRVLSQGELLTIYTMLAISTGLAGLDGVGILSQIVPHGKWFASSSNGWDRFLNAFPSWLIVTDRTALRGHFVGASTFYRLSILRAWITPILAWTLFTFLLLFVANCLNVVVRRQWADQERLTFPIVWLPLAMTDENAGVAFFRNRLVWAGAGIAAGISLLNGIAFLYPSVPSLPVGITDLHTMFSARPWSAIDWFPVTVYPIAIGLGYLLPLDLLFSCWLFFLFWRAQVVVSSAYGWDNTPDFPFIREQGFGAILALFLFYFYTGRRTYAKIWRSALRPERPLEQAPVEALSDRGALLGVALGGAGLLAFACAARVTLWVSASFLLLYVAAILVVTRIRAELGPPVHDFHFMGPDAMIPRIVSTSALRVQDMAFFTFAFSLTRAHRADTMPVGLEGLQMARMRGLEARRMFAAIMLATIVGTISAFWAFEHQAYALGAGAKFNQGFGHAQEAFERMDHWIARTQDSRPNGQAMIAMAAGLLVTLALCLLRLRYFGFPLHPIGFAISSSWAIHLVWVPLMIAWVLKGLTLRFGGLRAYRRAVPFFLGLALGDCVMGSAWSLLSIVLNERTYNFFGS
jgi:hypothetical protein